MDSRGYGNRPPMFLRPSPACGQFRGRMPWGSPGPPLLKKYRAPYIRPPFGITPEGLRMPTHMQPPPMFGPRGATIPPHLMDDFRNKGQCGRNQNKSRERNFDFWCDPCDRGFNTEELLNNHNKEHQKCGIDGCTFTAHMNVVTKHIQMQHSTGLYKKICKTETPEDIQNWINERKKNYPSRENIEKKKAQDQECLDRGEKLKDDKNRFNNKRNNSRYNKRTFHDRSPRNEKYASSQRKSTKLPEKTSSVTNKSTSNEKKSPFKTDSKNIVLKSNKQLENSDNEELYCNIKPFKGTSQLIRDDVMHDDTPMVEDNLDIEDDEWRDESVIRNKDETHEPTVCNALSNLICAYDSSDEEPAVEKIVKELKTITKFEVEKSNMDSCSVNFDNCGTIPETNDISNLDDNGSGPEEVEIKKYSENIIPSDVVVEEGATEKESSRKRTRKRKNSNKIDESSTSKQIIVNVSKEESNIINNTRKNIQRPHLKRRLPKTLLEKLLEKDIRKERNVILQCVHYVVQNNFFRNDEV